MATTAAAAAAGATLLVRGRDAVSGVGWSWMGNALEGFEGAPCCAADAGNAPASQVGVADAWRESLDGVAQQVKNQLLEAQQALHPSEARIAALFDLYDTDHNGALDPAELKDVMLDVYKGAIATLTECSIGAAEQAGAAAAAVTEVDRRWAVSTDPLEHSAVSCHVFTCACCAVAGRRGNEIGGQPTRPSAPCC